MCRAFGVDGCDDPRVKTIVERDHRTASVIRQIMDRCYAAAAHAHDRRGDRRGSRPSGCRAAWSSPPAELADDPHAVAIGLFEESDHPAVGRVRRPAAPDAVRRPRRPPSAAPLPALGQHTDEILAELGLADRIEALRASGAVS